MSSTKLTPTRRTLRSSNRTISSPVKPGLKSANSKKKRIPDTANPRSPKSIPNGISKSDTEPELTKLEKLYACPLPCREAQFGTILNFLQSNLEHKNSGCMYVSGVPGTGKTVIVKSVLSILQEVKLPKQKKTAFTAVYINGLTLSAPNRIWKRIYNELNPELKHRSNPVVSFQKLQSYFEKEHTPIILIIDELDQILDKQQAILYRLLDWTMNPSNFFSLICIFNTINLPESVLTLRNASRMGMSRCAFPPYTHEELSTIVKTALGDEALPKLGEAIMLISRKVAAISGDARRALELAKRTVEILEMKASKGDSSSAVIAVSEAFKDLFSSPKIDAVKHCSKLEKLVLRAIMGELQGNAAEETTIVNVMTTVNSALAYEAMNASSDQIRQALRCLFGSKLILMEVKSPSIHNKISLNISIPDIQYGLSAPAHE